ncbi:hypothetical protein ACTMTF_32195 [Nonomuraea sp. ZG12]|uniref:hypothetical protein n=1 Tax=Nonomuraea sp. ZG12 TaxID=3452207 RepID=UPI003F8892B3
MANFVVADLDDLVRIVKRKLKKMQYRPYLPDGCLAATGSPINHGDRGKWKLRVQLEYVGSSGFPALAEGSGIIGCFVR